MRTLLLLMIVSLGLGACGDDMERQEKLSKLRALGGVSNPVIPQPSADTAAQTAELTVYASVPLGATVTPSVFKDTEASLVVALDEATQEIIAGSESYTEYKGFRLYSVKVKLTMPTTTKFSALPYYLTTGIGKIRYGIKLASGSEEEKIVGDILVYPATAAESAWVAPTIDIGTPLAGATVKAGEAIDLQATVTDTNQEGLKVGWFTNDGKIVNRRAKSTQWTPPAAGEYSLIATARGRKSKALAIKVISVTAL